MNYLATVFRKISENLKCFLCVCFALISVSCAAQHSELIEAQKPELLIILATPTAAKKSEKSCRDFTGSAKKEAEQSFCLEGVIELTFEVDEIIYGQFKGEVIDVIDFHHSISFPQYLIEGGSYFALVKDNGHYILAQSAKYLGKGEFEWVCGKNLNPFVADKSFNAPPYTKIKEIDCLQGVELEELKRYFKSDSWQVPIWTP
ncbi:MAG: hypothetical protein MJK04_34500 [Psychrosphaera sp.]|nr:hypothetical protein [Psychrosphaera sp.]